jgi:hypothetical protein
MAVSCEHGKESSCFIKDGGGRISVPTVRLSACQEEVCSMELIIFSVRNTRVYPKVSGLSRERNIRLQQQTFVEKQHGYGGKTH